MTIILCTIFIPSFPNNKYKQIIRMKGAQIKKLNFVNNRDIICSILNEEFLELSGLDSSQSSSDLNFSTFRSSDFPSFWQSRGTLGLDKSIPLCRSSTKATIHGNIKQLKFRNSAKVVKRILCPLSPEKVQRPRPKKLCFVGRREKIAAILSC